MWVFDDAQRRLFLSLPAEAFGGYDAIRAICFAQTYALAGDARELAAKERGSGTGLRPPARARHRTMRRSHLLRGLALAYLGRRDEAIREGERGVALLPISRDAYTGAYLQHQLVRIYMVLGERDKALDRLEPLLEDPVLRFARLAGSRSQLRAA